MPSDEELLAQWSSASRPGATAENPTDLGTVGLAQNSPSDDDLLSHWQSTQALTPTEAVAGGFGHILNTLTLGAGDEITAGARGGLDALLPKVLGGMDQSLGDAYDSRLSQVRDINKRYSQTFPIPSATLDILPGFLTPLPDVLTKEAGAVNALKNVAKSAGIGAGYGSIFGFNSGEGGLQNRLIQAGKSGLEGTIIGGGLQSLVEGSQGIGKLLKSIVGDTFTPVDPAAKEIAASVISDYTGGNPQSIVEGLDKAPATPFADNMTVGEQANSSGLGLLTKVLEKTNPKAAIIKEAMDAERGLQRVGVFSEPQGVIRTQEATGDVLREGLAEAQGLQGEKVSQAYKDALVGDGTAPIFPAKKAISDAVTKQEESGIPIDSYSQAIVDKFREQPNHLTMEELDSQRKIVGSVLGDMSQMSNADPSQKAGRRVLSQLFGHIDEAEKAALLPENKGTTPSGIKKGFTNAQGKAIEKARALATEKGELFGDKGVADILDKNRYGKYDLYSSKIPKKALSSPEQARQVVNALKVKGSDGQVASLSETAQHALQSHMMEDLRSTMGLDGTFNAKSFDNKRKILQPIADEVLNSAQKKAVNIVSNDLLHEANFNASVGNASKGQSVTSQSEGMARFVKDRISEAVTSGHGILGKIFSEIGASRTRKIEAKVNENLLSLAFDKDFAREFLAVKSPEQVDKIATAVVMKALTPLLAKEEPALQAQTFSRIPASKSELGSRKQIPLQKTQGAKTESVSSLNALPGLLRRTTGKSMGQKEDIIAQIDSDPLDKTIFEIESKRGTMNTNSESSAKGAFQLIDETANKLGVKKVMDLNDNYKGYLKLKAENQARFGDDPEDLYGAHFLGATIYARYLRGEEQPKEWQREKVKEWEDIIRPRFLARYKANAKLAQGITEV